VDDGELVLRARDGARPAVDELARRHRRALPAAAVHLLGDLNGAEDAVQDALATAYERLETLREPDRFKQWMHTIVHRACVRGRTGKARREVAINPLPDIPVRDDDASAGENRVLRAINSLPQSYRDVLAARYISELSYAEMARHFGVAEGAVRVRVFRAKQRLRSVLAKAARAEAEATHYGMP